MATRFTSRDYRNAKSFVVYLGSLDGVEHYLGQDKASTKRRSFKTEKAASTACEAMLNHWPDAYVEPVLTVDAQG